MRGRFVDYLVVSTVVVIKSVAAVIGHFSAVAVVFFVVELIVNVVVVKFAIEVDCRSAIAGYGWPRGPLAVASAARAAPTLARGWA